MAQKEELAASASLRSSNRGPCLSSPAGQIDGVIYCTPVILYMDPDKTFHFLQIRFLDRYNRIFVVISVAEPGHFGRNRSWWEGPAPL